MKIICIGRNYQDHISELSNQRPTAPVVFIKPDSAVLPKEQDFYIPDFSSELMMPNGRICPCIEHTIQHTIEI